MTRTRLSFPIACALASLILAACGSDSDPAAPELEEVDSSTVVFFSHFNEENGGDGILNWTEFEEWNVPEGCVDLHGNGFIDVWPNNGVYVDMDGTCEAAGTLQTKVALELEPGEYLLEFWLAGNNRIDAPDTVIVSLEGLFEEELVMEREDPFELFTRTINVTQPSSALLTFQNLGGDDQGALLDLVRIRTPGEL